MTDIDALVADHERIWLEPEGCADPRSGRMWCQDKVWSDGDCECEPTEYVRADLLTALSDEIAVLKEREGVQDAALKPFAFFAEQFDRKPMSLDDEVYGIHGGTEWEASLRLSDCRLARAALTDKAGS